MNTTLTTKQLNKRFDQVLGSFRVGAVRPDSDAVGELADLANALEDAPVKPIVVARLTVTRAVGNRTIIDVPQNATFHAFYSIYTQTGRRHSTKRLVRTGHRGEGVKPYSGQTLRGLELLAARWQNMPGVTSVKIRIIRKRAYTRLLDLSPDQLGMNKVAPSSPLPMRHFSALGSPEYARRGR